MLLAQNMQNIAWDLWPDQQAQQLNNNQAQQLNNNQNGGNLEINLNETADPDMWEVIINPIAAPGAGNGDYL